MYERESLTAEITTRIICVTKMPGEVYAGLMIVEHPFAEGRRMAVDIVNGQALKMAFAAEGKSANFNAEWDLFDGLVGDPHEYALRNVPATTRIRPVEKEASFLQRLRLVGRVDVRPEPRSRSQRDYTHDVHCADTTFSGEADPETLTRLLEIERSGTGALFEWGTAFRHATITPCETPEARLGPLLCA